MPIGAAIGGAAATVGGSLLSARSQRRAAGQASDAQLQVAQQNNALAREFRDENQSNFQPWLNSGGRANGLVDSFLYGPAPAGPAAPAPAGPPSPTQPNALRGSAAFRALGGDVNSPAYRGARDVGDIGLNLETSGHPFRNRQAGRWGPSPTHTAPTGPAPGATAPVTPGGVSMDGYQAFVNSPYYQNPLHEGYRALNSGLASGGMLNSGDAMKRALRYGQDYGHGRMMEYIGLAGQQSDRGIQAAGSIAGVSQNALASMSGNNQNAANALSNAAIARGSANAGMYAGIGSALGGLAGAFLPSGYRG